MRSRYVSTRLHVLAIALLASSSAGAERFDPGCELSFKEIAEARDVDAQCPADGAAAAGPHADQNQAKNEFCAPGPARRLTLYSFKQLQAIATQKQIPFGNSNSLPPDRSVLADLYTTSDGNRVGEGSRVMLAAYVLEAHVANTSKGESVNCKHKGVAWNDIHVALGGHPDADLCDSVTAEISPHFRPDGWTAGSLEHFDGYPYRITGHLFFDASHTPCKNGKGSPRRMSNWEVHPVYAIDVCVNRSLASCDPRDESKWQPLNEAFDFEDEDEDEE